jgi:hypothetical protein
MMIRLNQEAVNLALALLVLVAGCTEAQQPQADVSPSSKLSAKSTQVEEAPQAKQALPKADANGDYSSKTSHKKWIVVDPDPNGVNCRWSEEMPTSWYAPDAKLPPLNINQWPVVRRFKENTPSQNLIANLSPAGFATLNDQSGKPWLKVTNGSNDQICFVRANSKYVQPVR